MSVVSEVLQKRYKYALHKHRLIVVHVMDLYCHETVVTLLRVSAILSVIPDVHWIEAVVFRSQAGSCWRQWPSVLCQPELDQF